MNKNKPLHTFCDDALSQHDGVALARLLKSKQLSPKEVIKAAIQRSQQVESQINAIETDCFEKALNEADSLGSGFFAGVPSFIKDNTPVKGLPTQHGTDAIRAKPARDSDPYAKQYLSQGFVLLGKSALPEFGFNATTEPAHKPATRNPWNTDYSTGASSGGSAALVAAGVVPIAHANDGGGSIRIPAACCGLIGLKPSRGRHIDSKQAKSLPIKIVSEGIVSRSVRDTAHFHAEAEKYYRNPKLPEIGLVEGPSNKRLRIGLVTDSILGYPIDSDTHATVESTARLLGAMGHSVEPMPIPMKESFIDDFRLYWAMLAYMTRKGGKVMLDKSFDADRVDGLSLGLSQLFKKNFYKAPMFLYRLKQVYEDYAKVFEGYDVILSPVLAHTAPKLGHISPTVPFDELMERLARYVSFTPLANVAGGPAISLPMGATTDNLPVSVQLASSQGQERTLLELAFEIEQAQPWRKIQDSI